MSINYCHFDGIYRDGQCVITNIVQGTFKEGSKQGLNLTDERTKTFDAHSGFINKTKEFGKRFFTGTLGAAIPLALVQIASSQPYNSTSLVFVAGAGLTSAVFNSKPMQSLKCGVLLGATAAAVTALNQDEMKKNVEKLFTNTASAVNEAKDAVINNGKLVYGYVVEYTAEAYEYTANSTSEIYHRVFG